MVYEGISFKIAANWVSKLYKLLLKIKQEKQSEIDSISDIFGNPFDLAKNYIEPDCQQFNPADETQFDSNVIRHPVFNYLEDVFFSGHKPSDGKNQLFILSDAGMGKTSLLVMLKLAHITSFWPQDYKCSLLKLGTSSIDEIRKIKGRQNHVIFLDALDEDPLAWKDIRNRIKNILSETRTFFRVIITCRTQFFSANDDPFDRRGQVEVEDYLCPVIFLSLFSDSQVKRYLENRFILNDSRTGTTKADEIYKIINKMGSLRCRPMLLSHAEDLLESEETNWSEFNVYQALVRAWLHRERRKEIWQSIGDPPTVESLLSVSKLVAESLQRSNRHTLNENMLQSLINKHPEAKYLKSIKVEGRSLLNKDSEGNFRFSHYSIQEFLLVKGIIDGDFIEISSFRSSNQIIKFIISWIGDDTHKKRTFKWNILDFSKYAFSSMDFSCSDLRNCNFKNIEFIDTNFSDSDLSRADLRGSNIKESTLSNANLYKAIIDGSTKFPEGFQIPDSVLLIQPKTKLIGENLSNISLYEADLSNSTIKNVVLDEANMEEAKFKGANLFEVSLCNATAIKAKFSDSKLEKVDFSGSNLQKCDFADATITNSNFNDCDLRKSIFTNSKFLKVSFKNANLIDANFGNAKFEKCDMDNVLWEDETHVSRR